MAYYQLLEDLRADLPITPGRSLMQEIGKIYSPAAARAMCRARKLSYLASLVDK